MKNIKKISIITFIIITSVILTISQSFACSCIMPENPTKSMENATSIFIWKVSKIENSWIVDELAWWMKTKQVTFDVSNIIKWDENNEIKITTPDSSASCWFNFQENKEYIVYTYWEKDKLEVSLCSRTALTSDASEDLKEFENIVKTPSSWVDDSNKNIYNNKFIYLFLTIITFLVILIYIKKISITKKKD